MATGSEAGGRTMHVSFPNPNHPLPRLHSPELLHPRLQLAVHTPLKQDQRHPPPVTEVDIEVFLTFSPCLYGYIKSVTPSHTNIGVYIYFYRANSSRISSNHNIFYAPYHQLPNLPIFLFTGLEENYRFVGIYLLIFDIKHRLWIPQDFFIHNNIMLNKYLLIFILLDIDYFKTLFF